MQQQSRGTVGGKASTTRSNARTVGLDALAERGVATPIMGLARVSVQFATHAGKKNETCNTITVL